MVVVPAPKEQHLCPAALSLPHIFCRCFILPDLCSCWKGLQQGIGLMGELRRTLRVGIPSLLHYLPARHPLRGLIQLGLLWICSPLSQAVRSLCTLLSAYGAVKVTMAVL